MHSTFASNLLTIFTQLTCNLILPHPSFTSQVGYHISGVLSHPSFTTKWWFGCWFQGVFMKLLMEQRSPGQAWQQSSNARGDSFHNLHLSDMCNIFLVLEWYLCSFKEILNSFLVIHVIIPFDLRTYFWRVIVLNAAPWTT